MRAQNFRFAGLAVATLISSMTATAVAQIPPAAPPPGEGEPAPAAPAAAPEAAPVAAAAPAGAAMESKMRLGLNVVPMP